MPSNTHSATGRPTKEEFSGNAEILSYLNTKEKTMKLTTIAIGNCARAVKLGCAGAKATYVTPQ